MQVRMMRSIVTISIKMTASDEIIHGFMELWKSYEYNIYKDLVKHTVGWFNEAFEAKQIKATLTHRAKKENSLEKKLKERNKKRPIPYRSDNGYADIMEDVVDLGGIRIAYHNPLRRLEIFQLIRTTFELKEEPIKFNTLVEPTKHVYGVDQNQEFTGKSDLDGSVLSQTTTAEPEYQNRFRGYSATHFRVKLVNDVFNQKPRLKQYQGRLIEIQVLSSLEQTWASFEHDILYKNPIGEPNDDEKRFLDGLCGILRGGDILFEQLQREHDSRSLAEITPFETEYDLGAFLRKWLVDRSSKLVQSLDNGESQNIQKLLGPPGTMAPLFEVLKKTGLDSPVKLRPKLLELDNNGMLIGSKVTGGNFNGSIIANIIFNVLSANPAPVRAFPQEECSERLKVIASTIIWLDVFFDSLHDLRQIVFANATLRIKQMLRWLMGANTSRTKILMGEVSSKEYLQQVLELWNWLSSHKDAAVKFAFKLAHTGVHRRFPEDIHLLLRIRALWKHDLEDDV